MYIHKSKNIVAKQNNNIYQQNVFKNTLIYGKCYIKSSVNILVMKGMNH